MPCVNCDSALRNLALQKASLHVTLVLLDMLDSEESNPFVVMQLAVMFASQCAKGGSMDLHFKTELPPSRNVIQGKHLLFSPAPIASKRYTFHRRQRICAVSWLVVVSGIVIGCRVIPYGHRNGK
jgi:hypothetical protein